MIQPQQPTKESSRVFEGLRPCGRAAGISGSEIQRYPVGLPRGASFFDIHAISFAATGTEIGEPIATSTIIEFTNYDRIADGFSVLKNNETLDRAGQMQADDMAAKSYFFHVTPDGKSPWSWLLQHGYQFSAAGENLAVLFSDAQDVETAWIASPEHRVNILDGQYTAIGVGIASGTYEGVSTTYIVELFGAQTSNSEE